MHISSLVMWCRLNAPTPANSHKTGCISISVPYTADLHLSLDTLQFGILSTFISISHTCSKCRKQKCSPSYHNVPLNQCLVLQNEHFPPRQPDPVKPHPSPVWVIPSRATLQTQERPGVFIRRQLLPSSGRLAHITRLTKPKHTGKITIKKKAAGMADNINKNDRDRGIDLRCIFQDGWTEQCKIKNKM